MSDTERHRSKSIASELIAVLRDHWELFGLELGYESQQLSRRLFSLALAFIFALLAAIVAQVAVIYGLMALGLSPAVACVIVASFYALIAVVIVWTLARRDPRAGGPFAGTRREVERTLSWIQKLFS